MIESQNNMKNSSKSDILVRPIRYLINGCTRSAELTVSVPLKIPAKWTRMLRMSQQPKIRVDDLLQVNFVQF